MTARWRTEVVHTVDRALTGARNPGTRLLRWLLVGKVRTGSTAPRADD